MLALIVTLWETMLFIDSRLHVVVSGTASTLDEKTVAGKGERDLHTLLAQLDKIICRGHSPDIIVQELTLLLLPVRQIGSQVSQLCRHNSSLD